MQRTIPGWEWVVARTTRWDRIVYAAVLVLLLGSLLVKPAWGVLDPGVVLSSAPDNGKLGRDWRDPWGNLYLSQPGTQFQPSRVWSTGPNGVDEAGRGDDVILVYGWRLDLYLASTELVLLLAGVLAGLWELRRLMRTQLSKPRAETLAPELLNAASLAIFLAVILGAIGIMFLRLLQANAPDTVAAVQEKLLVPAPVAVAGLAYLLSWGFFLRLRLRRPIAGSEE